jgi:hypothetical protein
MNVEGRFYYEIIEIINSYNKIIEKRNKSKGKR